MDTVVLKVDPANPEPNVIRRAAEVICSGGLVAFPTETVYGLGANALDSAAVARIFEAKGRPATNPVIVHVSGMSTNLLRASHSLLTFDASEVLNVAKNWPETAAKLALRFWPGPLTLVVPKMDRVPSIVTAGGSTVAVRCPNHAVARMLIHEACVPIAAPSANRSTELSPTRAEHVLRSLNGRIDLLLDGGPCSGGIESTVVDVTSDVPRVLRPGLITVPMLEAVCGRVEVGENQEGVSGGTHGGALHIKDEEVPRSPGQMAKHYSPRTPLVLVSCTKEAYRIRDEGMKAGLRILIIGFAEPSDSISAYYRAVVFQPEQFASELYALLHEVDQAGWDRIVMELPPDSPEWTAVRDRLIRAAAK